MIKQKTPNKFMSVPAIGKTVWDRVQDLHPKTLLMSALQPQSKDDVNPALYRKMVEEIYYTGTVTVPLHNKIIMWRTEMARMGIKSTLTLSNLKCLFIPRQKFLKTYDPANNVPVAELLELVTRQMEYFKELCEPTDESFQ